MRPMRREDVELDERALVDEHLDAIASRRLAGGTALVRGLGLRVQRLVAALAVLVDLLLGDRRRLALGSFDPFETRSGPTNGRK